MPARIHVDIGAQVGTLDLQCQLDVEGVTALIGPNGAGKSTVLKSLLGDRRPDRGRISVDDVPLFCAADRIDVPIQARRLGYVPQRFALFPHLTVADNIGFGLAQAGKDERRRRVAALVREFQIEDLAARKPGNLSGGESQRVAMARALAINPRALLLDEPMSALDATSKRAMRTLLAERLQRLEIPTLLVTHDVADVESLAHRIAVLEQGTIVQTGSLAELRAAPASEFVAELLGKN